MESLLQTFDSLLLSHMFPCMNRFLIIENIFLPPLMNRKSTDLRIVTSKDFKL